MVGQRKEQKLREYRKQNGKTKMKRMIFLILIGDISRYVRFYHPEQLPTEITPRATVGTYPRSPWSSGSWSLNTS
jgi:hypothetical protein